MKSTVRVFWTTLAFFVVSFGCTGQSPTGPQALAASAPRSAAEAAEGKAELYIFNSSSWTQKPAHLDVTDNGEPLVSLPRSSYRKMLVAPGAHTFRLKGREMLLDAAGGRKYYIVVAYQPEHSWGVRHAKDPLVIRRASEEEAVPLMKGFKAQ